MSSNLSETGARMVTKLTAQKRYVAVSHLEWEIHNLSEINNDIRNSPLTSDEVQLMEFSEASWTVDIQFGFGDGFRFIVDLCGIPEDLIGRSRAFMFVSCQGQSLCSFSSDYFDSFESKFTRDCYEESLSDFFEVESVLFSFRLAIDYDDELNTCCKFYDAQAYRKSLLNSVADMLGDPTFADFTFIVGGKEFKVHMNILATASPVMRRMFTGFMEEAKTKTCSVDAITPEIFAHMLRFIYNCVVPEDLEAVAMSLYEAAHYYQIENLEKVCLQEIRDNLSPDNALEVFEWVQPYDFKVDVWKTIKCDILKIFADFNDEPLPLDKIKAILQQRQQEKTFWKDIEVFENPE